MLAYANLKKNTFILEVDASHNWLGEVLLRKHDEKVYPVTNVHQQTNKA